MHTQRSEMFSLEPLKRKKTIANTINKTITYICTHHGKADGARERIQLLDSLVNEAVLQSVGPVTNQDPAVFSLKIKGMWHLPLK